MLSPQNIAVAQAVYAVQKKRKRNPLTYMALVWSPAVRRAARGGFGLLELLIELQGDIDYRVKVANHGHHTFTTKELKMRHNPDSWRFRQFDPEAAEFLLPMEEIRPGIFAYWRLHWAIPVPIPPYFALSFPFWNFRRPDNSERLAILRNMGSEDRSMLMKYMTALIRRFEMYTSLDELCKSYIDRPSGYEEQGKKLSDAIVYHEKDCLLFDLLLNNKPTYIIRVFIMNYYRGYDLVYNAGRALVNRIKYLEVQPATPMIAGPPESEPVIPSLTEMVEMAVRGEIVPPSLGYDFL
jgi:hypothetical protein